MTDTDFTSRVSDLRDHVDNLGVWLAIWEGRGELIHEDTWRCSNDAMGTIDAAIRQLLALRDQLTAERREARAEQDRRVDELLGIRCPRGMEGIDL